MGLLIVDSMNMKRKKLIAATLFICLSTASLKAETVIYLDLALGNISINGGTKQFTGYVGVGGESKQLKAQSFDPANTTFYIYQSSTVSGSPWTVANTGYASTADYNAKTNVRIPAYSPMQCNGKTWGDYITNNSNVEQVASNWETSAAAVKRNSTKYNITIHGSAEYKIVIDNIWSSFCSQVPTGTSGYGRRSGGITIRESGDASNTVTKEKVTLKLIGDNRLSNIYYTNKLTGSDASKSKGYLHITSYDGDNSNSGSLTLAYPNGYNMNREILNNDAIIGGTYDCNGEVKNLEFNGGTVFAGCQKINNGIYKKDLHPIIHIVGGRHDSQIKINGGRLTAVNNGTAAAIGGGGGYVNLGNKGIVTITGGEIYAYNHSVYALEYNQFIPCVAIGGGSGVEEDATDAEITITGGKVYAQSAGGVAIGGGGSSKGSGGSGTVTISGGEVTAKSLSGKINNKYPYVAGNSIGGGTGSASGGNAVFNISGTDTKLMAASVGGGMYTKSGGKFGTADVTITDGDIQAQFVMEGKAGASSQCNFTMTGGIIHNSSSQSTEFVLTKKDGGALWINDPSGVVKVSDCTISDCTAENGGAIYQTGGKLTISGSTIISGNKALENGGAAYINGGTTTFSSSSAYIQSNSAVLGGGLYINGGTIDFKANIAYNTALNGGGLYLGPGASMKFQGGLVINNNAVSKNTSVANTAYHGGSNIEGCGGGIYLQNGTSSTKKTTLSFDLDPNDRTFGLYANRADKAGDDVVAEGQYTEVRLPSIRDMQLYGFDGKDATPFWYQDYFLEDTGYDNTTANNGTHAVDGIVDHVDRFRDIIAKYTNDYLQHRIPDERLAAVKNNYLCLTLSYNMLDITLTANNLEGSETALFQLVRHGSTNDYKYDVLLKKGSDGKASRTLRNMPWGTYSVIPNDSWNWAYDRIDPKYNFRLGETGNYEFVFDMLHHNNAETPRHDETQPQ